MGQGRVYVHSRACASSASRGAIIQQCAHALALSEALSHLLSDSRSLPLVLSSQGSSAMAGKVCPQGFYCEGGPLDKAPCTCDPGFHCPAGSSNGNGTICPEGHACIGGTADAVECQCPPGKFCPEGEKQLFGKTCNPGTFCTGTALCPKPYS